MERNKTPKFVDVFFSFWYIPEKFRFNFIWFLNAVYSQGFHFVSEFLHRATAEKRKWQVGQNLWFTLSTSKRAFTSCGLYFWSPVGISGGILFLIAHINAFSFENKGHVQSKTSEEQQMQTQNAKLQKWTFYGWHVDPIPEHKLQCLTFCTKGGQPVVSCCPRLWIYSLLKTKVLSIQNSKRSER